MLRIFSCESKIGWIRDGESGIASREQNSRGEVLKEWLEEILKVKCRC